MATRHLSAGAAIFRHRLSPQENSNVQMAFNVYQTALEEGVHRVVVSSSNHAADFWEPHILKVRTHYLDSLMMQRTDSDARCPLPMGIP